MEKFMDSPEVGEKICFGWTVVYTKWRKKKKKEDIVNAQYAHISFQNVSLFKLCSSSFVASKHRKGTTRWKKNGFILRDYIKWNYEKKREMFTLIITVALNFQTRKHFQTHVLCKKEEFLAHRFLSTVYTKISRLLNV